MTKLTITDPSEAAPNSDGQWTGYWSVNIEENHDLVASINLHGSALPDFNDPEDAAEFFEEVGEGIRVAGESFEDLEAE